MHRMINYVLDCRTPGDEPMDQMMKRRIQFMDSWIFGFMDQRMISGEGGIMHMRCIWEDDYRQTTRIRTRYTKKRGGGKVYWERKTGDMKYEHQT